MSEETGRDRRAAQEAAPALAKLRDFLAESLAVAERNFDGTAPTAGYYLQCGIPLGIVRAFLADTPRESCGLVHCADPNCWFARRPCGWATPGRSRNAFIAENDRPMAAQETPPPARAFGVQGRSPAASEELRAVHGDGDCHICGRAMTGPGSMFCSYPHGRLPVEPIDPKEPDGIWSWEFPEDKS